MRPGLKGRLASEQLTVTSGYWSGSKGNWGLMDMALAFCDARWPAVRLSAQAYLQPFYESLDFAITSEPYLEDDIPHIDMLRSR